MLNALNRLLNVPSEDAGDARRRKLLNILLLGVAALTIMATITMTPFGLITGTSKELPDAASLVIPSAIILSGVAIIYLVNRYRSGRLASTLFLVVLVVGIMFTDEPEALANGRSLYIFTVPIIMASVILHPRASFVMAVLVNFAVLALAMIAQIVPNLPAMLGFLLVAVVSWLSARSLERALADLNTINQELDQHVVERTQDLYNALDRVKAESNKNEAILRSIADGVIVFGVEGKAIIANTATGYLLDWPVKEIIGKDIDMLMEGRVTPEDQQTVHEILMRDTLHTPNTKLEWGGKTLSVSFAMVRDAKRGPIGTVTVFRDFTREAELDLMKSAFVSMASHELRTPLNAILGYTDMLQENVHSELNDDQRGITNRIMANSRRMLSLVNNLLDQAQIEAGRLSLRLSAFSPSKLLKDVEMIASILASNKGLELRCKVADDLPPTLTSDPQRLEQILINLVGNAVKFTEQGYVSMQARSVDQDHWALEVADTGAGIPLEAQSYIFDAFRQVDDPVTRKHSGSGLGLSIVKQLTTLMGGEIQLESEVGKGSTFTIVLPIKLPQEAHHE
jgi:signal transduction histidine kinase